MQDTITGSQGKAQSQRQGTEDSVNCDYAFTKEAPDHGVVTRKSKMGTKSRTFRRPLHIYTQQF